MICWSGGLGRDRGEISDGPVVCILALLSVTPVYLSRRIELAIESGRVRAIESLTSRGWHFERTAFQIVFYHIYIYIFPFP